MTFREWSQAYGKSVWSRARYAWTMLKTSIYPGLVLVDDSQLEISSYGPGSVRELPATEKQLLELYNIAVWVYIGCARKADVIADLPWILKREVKGSKDEIVKDHPVRDFLWEPGPNRTWHDLIFGTSVFLDLGGRSYWELVPTSGRSAERGGATGGEERGPLSEIVPLYPQHIKVRIDKEQGVVGYVYKPGSDEVRYDDSEILWIRHFSPLEEYGAASPVRSSWLSTQLDVNARKWNDLFFRRGAQPETYLTSGKQIPRDERARIEKDFENRNRGIAHGRGLYFLPPDVDVKSNSVTQRDMQFEAMRKATREEILAALGVPPIWVGVETANYATARTQEAVAMRRVCIPTWNRIVARITQEILPRFPDSEGLYLAIDESELRIPEEQDDRHAKIVVEFKGGLISREEAREKLGYEREVKGDARDPEANAPLPRKVPDEETFVEELGGNRGPQGPDAVGLDQVAEKAIWRAPESVRQIVQKAISDAEAFGGEGTTERSLALAKRIVSGDGLTESEVRRISSWHDRHDGEEHGERHRSEAIAFELRGGAAGRQWAREAADEADVLAKAARRTARTPANGNGSGHGNGSH